MCAFVQLGAESNVDGVTMSGIAGGDEESDAIVREREMNVAV